MAGVFRSSLLLIVAATLLACPSVASGQGQGAAPKFTFEIKLEKEAYLKEVSSYDPARVDPAKVAASRFPAYAALVESVTPGGQADRAGLKPGWRIIALNGREIWERHQGLPMEDGKREIQAISPEGEKKIFHFEDGVIGTSCINSRNPEVWVLQNIPRGKWDGDILVATAAWNAGDHELAETALRLAVNRGMPPNPVLTYYASLLALDRGNDELARALNAELMKKYPDPDKIPHFYREGLTTLGSSLGDFGLLQSVAKAYEGFNRPFLQPQIVEMWKAWKEDTPRSPLLPLAKKASGPDLLSKCTPVVVKWQSAAHVMDFEPARDGTYIKEMQPKGYDRLSFGPPEATNDLIWTIRFGFRETARPDTVSTLSICLADKQGKSSVARQARYLPFDKAVVSFQAMRFPGPLGQVELGAGPCGAQVDSQCNLTVMTAEEFATFKGLVESKSPESKKITRHVNELSLIRFGTEAEIILNGKSLLHAPIDPKVEDLFCIIQNEGLSVIIDGMTLQKIGGE